MKNISICKDRRKPNNYNNIKMSALYNAFSVFETKKNKNIFKRLYIYNYII